MQVKQISVTPDAEQLVAYCARVSSSNQDNPDIAGLLRYCVAHGHWSVFEQAHMTVEIITSRNIARQIIRHKSFSFQEFSQRYSDAVKFEHATARGSAHKNRQSSVDNLSQETKDWWDTFLKEHQAISVSAYQYALRKGIAREVARDLLLGSSQTRLYMTGNIRSWIHFIELREKEDTQLEHQQIVASIKELFTANFPTIAEAVQWHQLKTSSQLKHSDQPQANSDSTSKLLRKGSSLSATVSSTLRRMFQN